MVSAAPFDLVCVGHIVQEMVYSPDRTTGPMLGSPPAYCSVAAARQGTTAGIVTKIGVDMPAELLQAFAEAGVDTRGILWGERTTASELIYDTKGNKEIRYLSKADPIKAVDMPKVYNGCRMIYLCPMDNDIYPEDLAEVVAFGRCSAVDLGGYGGVHMSKASREAIPSLPEMACRVSSHFKIVKVSDEDAKTIFGWNDPDRSGRKLLACGPEVVVVTLGAKGVFVYTPEGCIPVPSLSGEAIDTTGAGDTFMAGFLSEYLRSADPLKSARWGCATASYVIEHSGGVFAGRMPDHKRVQDRMKKYYQEGKK